MTSILSSIFPAFTSGVSTASQVSGNQSSSATQQSQGTSGSIFGEAFSLNISEGGLGALGGSTSPSSGSSSDTLSALAYSGSTTNAQGGTSSFEALLFNLTGDSSGQSSDSSNTASTTDTSNSTASNGGGDLSQLFSFLNQLLVNAENSLENVGSGSSSTTQAVAATTNTDATNSNSFAEAALASGGPLPAFIAKVDSQLHLNSQQQQSLQNIANQYQNADNTPDTVSSIAAALQQAGIQS